MLKKRTIQQSERGGFEPPVPLPVQLLSREPDSAALAPLQGTTDTVRITFSDRKNTSGERGIRTPGDLRLNGFQDRLHRPLGHLSNQDFHYTDGMVLCQVKVILHIQKI